MPYIPHTEEETRQMLDTVGVSFIEELFADIPAGLRPKSFDLPSGLSEMQVMQHMEHLADKNFIGMTSFIGAGFYNHYIPAAVDALSGRSEFYTAYTPYQAEASQGALQAIFEYQTAMARLFDMDVANASVYDGGSALFEGMMMGIRAAKKREKLVVSETLSPIYRAMLDSYTANLGLSLVTVPHKDGATDIEGLFKAVDRETAALAVQNPDFFGQVSDFTALFAHAKDMGVTSVISGYPIMQSVLKTPGAMGADVAVAEGQSLGLPLSFGGPYLGIMTCTRKMARQMPGRIAGRTEDEEGKVGYVLTLQAREQHIRRQKATSNICSNQALCALRALIYLSLMGPEGLEQTALRCMELARYAATRLAELPGVSLLSDKPFCNEFVVRLPKAAHEVAGQMVEKKYLAGFPLSRYYKGMDDCLLVACTEQNSEDEIDIMVETLGGILA